MTVVDEAPYLALMDDDTHSARLMSRELLARGAPRIEWLGGAEDGPARLQAILTSGAAKPGLLIVDIKASSAATRDLVAGLSRLARQHGLLIVAMSTSLDREHRNQLLEAGAAAVFLRHADRDAYRQEAASIVNFWARSQRPDAVGM